jgi:hypothetical protein
MHWPVPLLSAVDRISAFLLYKSEDGERGEGSIVGVLVFA